MKIKIGRNEYEITKRDIFMDNGACIQLMSQNKERVNCWGHRSSPVLYQRAAKQVNKYARIQKKHKYRKTVEVFSLDI